jgi:ornithine--oxo-acid transaminase
MFCCDHEDVIPDVYILAKALGGGFCASAVVANDDIMRVMTPGDHGSTFGGNPFVCAVANEALSILADEHLAESAAEMGGYFVAKLRAMNAPCIKEIRGKGLLIGVEIKPEFGTAPRFVRELIANGVIVKETHETTIRFAPPLIITKGEIDFAIARIEKVFEDLR